MSDVAEKPIGIAVLGLGNVGSQVVRIIVSAPGSLSGRYPEGNTGRVAAGLMRPMPVPGDIASALRS
mgnify:CR=1 FL=1